MESIIVFVVGATLYSLTVYMSKRTKEGGEVFKPRKFARAVVVGLIVGVYAHGAGIEVSINNFEHLAMASGATVLGDQVVKALWRLKDQIPFDIK